MICTARWLGYFSLKSTTTYWLGYSMTIRKWSLRGMCIYWLSAVRRRRFLYHERMVLSWCSWSLPICNMLLVLDMTFESSVRLRLCLAAFVRVLLYYLKLTSCAFPLFCYCWWRWHKWLLTAFEKALSWVTDLDWNRGPKEHFGFHRHYLWDELSCHRAVLCLSYFSVQVLSHHSHCTR